MQLKLSNQKAAAAVAKAVSTPGSPQYGKYLTAAQWERRFSPSAAAVARVTAFLKASGFTVQGAAADRTEVSASGPASRIEHVFSTSLSYHRVDGLKLRLADRSLSIPSSLAGIVLGVVGVNQTLAHPDHTTDNPVSPATGSPFPQPPGFRVASPCGAYYNQLLDTTLPPYGHGYRPPRRGRSVATSRRSFAAPTTWPPRTTAPECQWGSSTHTPRRRSSPTRRSTQR